MYTFPDAESYHASPTAGDAGGVVVEVEKVPCEPVLPVTPVGPVDPVFPFAESKSQRAEEPGMCEAASPLAINVLQKYELPLY